MGDLVDLPDARSRWFADERGRSLRATWHPQAGLVVLSLWQADRCVSTFRLSGQDAAALSGSSVCPRSMANPRDDSG